MSDIHVYTLEDAHGNESGTFATGSYEEARDRARADHLRVIDNTYVWDDSEMVDDFTEEEPEPADYDPGPEVDDEGGMSEYRHAGLDSAPYE